MSLCLDLLSTLSSRILSEHHPKDSKYSDFDCIVDATILSCPQIQQIATVTKTHLLTQALYIPGIGNAATSFDVGKAISIVTFL